MIKMVVLLKRRDGMSMEEFIDYYENHHAKIGEKHMPLARRYVRRYVRPVRNPISEQVAELDFDVVMELWWDSREDYEATMKQLGDADLQRLVYEDEEKIFNSHNNRAFMVEEYESEMTPGVVDLKFPRS